MSRHGKVLVIDDDQDFRASVRALLESQGYAVFAAESGNEGLRMLVEHNPDAIILDIMMETSVEGYGVTHALKHEQDYERYRHIPIIMVSSIEEAPDERFPMAPEAEMIQPDNYLTKPLDISRFLEVVRRHVAPEV